MGWVTFFISILLLKQFFQIVFSMYPELITSINVTWVHLWMAATLGGVMALRLKRAYVLLATGISLFILFAICPRF
jgi:PTS system mannose-specific IIC component